VIYLKQVRIKINGKVHFLQLFVLIKLSYKTTSKEIYSLWFLGLAKINYFFAAFATLQQLVEIVLKLSHSGNLSTG
jgi:hypothetical protein